MRLQPAERRILRIALALALLGATALSALGRFRSALALTTGAAVAIVSGLWMADVAGRLVVPRARSSSRGDSGFAARAVFRYLLTGLVLFGAVRWLSDRIVWLLVGLSAVVAAIGIEAALEAGPLRGDPGGPEDGGSV